MKEYFYEKDNKAYIIDNDEGIITRDAKDNMEEILIAENDIEEIDSMLKTIKNEKKLTDFLINQEGKKQKILTILLFIAIVSLFFVSYQFLPSVMLIPAMMAICYGVFALGSVFNNKALKNDFKCHNIILEQCEAEYDKSKSKLNELNKVAKDKIVDSTVIKKVPKSELIDSLMKKRDLITHYFNNKKKYLSAYKNKELENLLRIDGYSDSDIKLINFLIEEEISIKEKGHQKKYTN